ncbi:hypothetical protein AVEN_112444-1 [Araneus ventricosus]|uniref:Uncharacterized protein n=1 Tax=Araneus ventricosus TaxID=182803 RepID=A0A4Y2UV84_ARAVE|nr:hypothetical protein AVEN_23750-1 [Araneus ventricosus]GBO15367.1 hypothetical protein AVEN_112444-1 [Araneus ventricosus]
MGCCRQGYLDPLPCLSPKRSQNLTSPQQKPTASDPDSNFNLQQACHKFVMTRVQACSKLTKDSKSPWNELAASLPCKLIANYSKNRVRTQPGIDLATYRLVARRRYHSASSTTRGEDRFR